MLSSYDPKNSMFTQEKHTELRLTELELIADSVATNDRTSLYAFWNMKRAMFREVTAERRA